jgi:protein phosphatase
MSDLPTINLALYAQTDVGMVRSGNEDNFLILDLSSGKSWTANEDEPPDLLTYAQGYYGTLLAVSDGMGGALAGEVASRIAVETVRDRMLQLQAHDHYGKVPFSERLRLAVEEANSIIHTDGQTNQAHRGLGATFTAVATNGSHLYFAQVGDSRAHLIRQGKITRITKDQSLVQQLIDAGQITEEEAETHSYRNVILQALGAHNNVNVEVNEISLCQLDTLVLCSDGLSGKMHADEVARIVHEASDFKSACQSLINLANERGGEDNITVVIAQFSGAGLPLPDIDSVEPKSLARSPDTPTEINWTSGPTTDPLDDLPDEPQNPSGGGVRKTEPLPSPPKQSTPFTAQLARSSVDRQRTNDLSDRVGPITAVFAPEDSPIDEDEKSHVTAEQKPLSHTAPLDPRLTKPLSAGLPELPREMGSPTHPASSNNHDGAQPVKRGSKTNLTIFIGLVFLGIAGLVITATSYLRQQKADAEARQVASARAQEETQKEKQGSIEQVKTRIATLRNKLELGTASKPAAENKLEDWRKRLAEFEQQLDSLNNKSLDETKQTCLDIERQIQQIDDEFTKAQGLLPLHPANRQPVKV